ncbi:MAG: ATP-binding protein [Promethearchaeota archaeon]
MNKEKIIEILSSWNFWNKKHDTGIFREKYLEKLNNLLKTEQIIAITGIRRSGKTTLMKQFIKKKIIEGENPLSFLYVNLEEPKFLGELSLEFLQQIYDAYIELIKPNDIPYILLDEVQNINGWERFVRALHEKKEAHIIVSGSTSKLLGKELGTLLTGRWLELKVYPLDFKEFLDFKGIELKSKLDLLSNKSKIKQLLREYLEFGGFPLVVLKEEKEEILERYFNDIVGRDIIERYKIRKIEKLRFLAKYYLTNISSLITYRRIAKFMGLSLDSVERFSSYLMEICVIFLIPKFSYTLKVQEVNPKKVYCIDPGLANFFGFRFSDNIGKLYENIVYLSLIENKMQVYYYKNKNECDFVIMEGQKITKAIQVSYEITENKEREINGLLEAMNFFNLEEGFIITEDFESEEIINNKKIKYIPLWKWLLE